MSKEKRDKIYIMAIKPKYAKAIYEGKKNWEFRKVPPPLLEPILLYESAPVSAITGMVLFGVEIKSLPSTVFELIRTNKTFTQNLPGITLKELQEYTGKNKCVSALRVIECSRFEKPKLMGVNPPVNWGRYFLRPVDEKGGEK